jgi:hypothetical protein
MRWLRVVPLSSIRRRFSISADDSLEGMEANLPAPSKWRPRRYLIFSEGKTATAVCIVTIAARLPFRYTFPRTLYSSPLEVSYAEYWFFGIHAGLWE